MVPAPITASHLPELKSTFEAHVHGWNCEQKAADWLASRDWRLKARRLRTPYAEIDLVFEEAGILHAVEVKSLGPASIIDFRVSRRQKQRLMRAREFLQDKYGMLVSLDLLFVGPNGEFNFFPDFLS